MGLLNTYIMYKKYNLYLLLVKILKFLYNKICDWKAIACPCFTWITNFNLENTNYSPSNKLSEYTIQSVFEWSFGSQ